MPLYQRGLYFDGSDDMLTVTGLTLHHSFTIHTWLKILTFSQMNIFSISRPNNTVVNDEEWLNWKVNAFRGLYLVMNEGATNLFQLVGDTGKTSVW
jgi:hypothetical protein